MRSLLLTLFMLSILGNLAAQEFEMADGDTTYVMKKYYLCLIYKGENRSQDSLQTAEIQQAHLSYMDSLASAGKLHMAGPMDGDGDLRGITILDAKDYDEALKLTKNDHAAKAGRLRMQVHPWWAAKGSVLK